MTVPKPGGSISGTAGSKAILKPFARGLALLLDGTNIRRWGVDSMSSSGAAIWIPPAIQREEKVGMEGGVEKV